MGSYGETKRRPICPKCTKPMKLCLCSRFSFPPLDNSIHITVLQHDHEIKHPLNSTRVAKLGLKNLSVIHVSDVNLHVQLVIHPLNHEIADFAITQLGVSRDNGEFSDEKLDNVQNQMGVSRVNGEKFEVSSLEEKRLDLVLPHLGISNGNCCTKNEKERSEFSDSKGTPTHHKNFSLNQLEISSDSCHGALNCCNGDDSNNCTIKDMNKYKVICSNTELNIILERTARPNLNWVLNTPIGQNIISNGFQVKKFQTKKKPNSTEIYKIEEYDIIIPPNSALLFPTEESVGLNSINFEVKSLIVLDGTWAKAQRMYHENPWLKLLPRLKLDFEKESLYSEVRHEPKAGCLSTIESIIFAMKELGDDLEGLDSILGVFESMILDQRRCKDEKLCVSSQN